MLHIVPSLARCASPPLNRCLPLALIASLAATATAQSPFTYQGQLREGGEPVNGTFTISFSLYDAAAGGNQIGMTLTSGIAISDGLFTRELDFGANAFPPGNDRWLEVQIGANPPMAPRARVTPAPEAHGARSLRLPFAGTANVAAPECALDITNAANGPAICGQNTSPTGAGIWGQGLGNGANVGVFGRTQSNHLDAAGIYGEGPRTGVWGHTDQSGGARGVYGSTSVGGGVNYGVYGLGRGSSISVGVYGESTNWIGVEGKTSATSGQTAGVRGYASATTGATQGVFGQNASSSEGALGVFGWADSATGITYGVRGKTSSSTDGAAGVLGDDFGGNGMTRGVEGRTFSTGFDARGVFGIANAGTGLNSGVYGQTNSNDPSSRGVFGWAPNGGRGVAGECATASGVGGYFKNRAGGIALLVDGEMRTEGKSSVPCLELRGGCDVAEPFAVHHSGSAARIEPGMLVAIDPDRPGQLRLASEPYDRRVAGVLSGANNVQPGMVLQGDPGSGALGDWPVALAGRVYAWCDASYGAIQPGDRLTTSATPGHAMRVSEEDRAAGAVVGKAMTALTEGRGHVLVLVQPQ